MPRLRKRPPPRGRRIPPPPAEKPEQGINVVTYPAGASVTIAGQSYGTTPVVVKDLAPGSYAIVLDKWGYHTVSVRIDYDGTPMVLATALEEITGFIHVTSEPADAEVLLDGGPLPAAGARLRIGSYEVSVRAFGYEEHVEQVTIREDALASIHVVLPKAAFAFSWLDATRTTFNPANYGNLGVSRIFFRVTAPGAGRLRIVAPDGSEVLAEDFPSFVTWDYTLTWDGRATGGAPLADGVYRVTLEGQGADGVSAKAQELALTVDRSAVIVYRSLLSGASGLLYAPSPEVLPRGAVQISLLALAHSELGDDGASFRLPVGTGVRVGLGVAEVDVQAGATFSDSAGSLPLFASVSGRYAYATPRGGSGFGGAVGARIAYDELTTDTRTNFTGLALNAPLRLLLTPVSIILTPEIIASWRRVRYDTAAETAFWLWGYCRAGVLVDAGPVMLGLSTALRTAPFSEGFALELPMQAALELHVTIPGTEIVLSGAVAAEIAGIDDFYLMGGGGFGFLH